MLVVDIRTAESEMSLGKSEKSLGKTEIALGKFEKRTATGVI